MIVRTIAPEGMPRPTGEEGHALLDVIWAHFNNHQSWPTFDDVDRKLYSARLDYEEAVQQLCPALLRGISSDISRMPQGSDQLSLTIAGAANCNDAGPALDVFLQMVRAAATNEPRFRPKEPGEQPRLLSRDLGSMPEAKSPQQTKAFKFLEKLQFTAAALGLQEPCFRGGTLNVMDLTWSLTYDRGIRPFADVRRVDGYWRIRERELGPERTAADILPFSKAKGPREIYLGLWPSRTPAVPAPAAEAVPAPAAESPGTMSVTCTLHPLIAKVAAERYNRGSYNDAVRSAFQAVEHRVQTLLGIHEVGEKLMGTALGKPPKITVTRSTGGSLDSEQNGMHFLFRGAMGALRNPRSHGPDEKDDRDEADEMLVFASFLMRRLDIEDEKRKAAASGP
ncbi:TIGR02391 family protein [Streptomyces sp. NPDC056190]|uniref:TIGR02391 family protein n=1 Tax=Streptomyces sp. NPDC056190 TaxID=3345741 RepID=UPI0035DB882D